MDPLINIYADKNMNFLSLRLTSVRDKCNVQIAVVVAGKSVIGHSHLLNLLTKTRKYEA